MRRSNSEHISDILQRYLREEGLETPLNQHRLINSWGDVMGQGILRYTGDIFIKNQTLYVQIRSSVLKQELIFESIAEAEKLGYEMCVMPKTNAEKLKNVSGIRLIGVSSLREVKGIVSESD